MLANDLKLVTKDIAAEVFSVSVKTIDNYIKDGLLPPPKRFVSKEYWHPDDFRAFLARTFQAAAQVEDRVTGVTERVVAAAPMKEQSRETRAPEPGQAKDTSPLVRQRNRQKERLKQLNA